MHTDRGLEFRGGYEGFDLEGPARTQRDSQRLDSAAEGGCREDCRAVRRSGLIRRCGVVALEHKP